jgi:DNA-binding transcriptional LysR family regulator
LNEAGRCHLSGAEKILLDIDEVEETAGADRLEVRGTLRINAPLSFGFLVLAPLMVEFSKLHPAINISQTTRCPIHRLARVYRDHPESVDRFLTSRHTGHRYVLPSAC